MLSDNKIIALYRIVDDVLKAMRHRDDPRVRVCDSEVITTAFVAVLYFGGHLYNARHFMAMNGYVPRMLDKSKFCRRLHRPSGFLLSMFEKVGKQLRDIAGAADYRLDSLPVAACDNIRIGRCRVLGEEAFHPVETAPHGRMFASFIKEHMRKHIKTEFSMIKAKMLRSIYAVTKNGFLLKVALFVIAFTFYNIV